MTKTLGWVSLALMTGTILLAGVPAYADTTVPTVTGTDGYGSTFQISATCNASNVCQVTLQITTTSSTAQPDINAVAFKIGSSDSFSGTLSVSNWSTYGNSLNNNSLCSGSSSNTQICSQANSTSSEVATLAASGGTTLTWTWTGVSVSQLSFGHVGYKYDDGSGTLNGFIVSCNITNGVATCATTPVPEPTSLSLMAIGFLGLLTIFGCRLVTRV